MSDGQTQQVVSYTYAVKPELNKKTTFELRCAKPQLASRRCELVVGGKSAGVQDFSQVTGDIFEAGAKAVIGNSVGWKFSGTVHNLKICNNAPTTTYELSCARQKTARTCALNVNGVSAGSKQFPGVKDNIYNSGGSFGHVRASR